MGEILRVNTIYPTIQCEGALTGTPMVLVRTQGCNVGCSWCDTKETWNSRRGSDYTTQALVSAVTAARTGHQWVMLTGGEPVQQDCGEHIAALRSAGFKVALETSGHGQFIPTNCDWFCLSPKRKPWSEACYALADEVKFVIAGEADVERAQEAWGERWAKASPSLQPLWGSDSALRVCIDASQRLGWRLSVQQHKFLNIQ